jgi:para-nitrobenzyl esterase
MKTNARSAIMMLLFLMPLPACESAIGEADGDDHPEAGGPEVGGVPLVATDRGPVEGTAEDDGLRVFLGIPYAAPPLGAFRFAPPQPAAPWSEPLDVTSFAPVCAQSSNFEAPSDTMEGDEDCLYLNVWAPPAGPPRPVMVFLHGGGNISGNSRYPGEVLARRTGHVVVTVAYRLGPLGFLSLEGASGNAGFMDQQAALGWVQRNIAAFGGDPARVMLFGESAGALGVCVQTVAPGSEGLFRAAIAESFPACATMELPAQARSRWQALAAELGCGTGDRIACLRQMPADELVLAGVDVGAMSPVLDGEFLTDHGRDVWRRGDRADDVALVVGMNKNEGGTTIEALRTQQGWTSALLDSKWGYHLAIDLVWPQQAAELKAMYRYEEYRGGLEAIETLGTDVWASCPTRAWARAWARGGGDAWLYDFTAGLRGDLARFGSAHGIELAFLFDYFDELDDSGLTDEEYVANFEERALAEWMQDRWGQLAADGTMHGGAGCEAWAPVSEPETLYFEIGLARGLRSVYRGDRCDRLVELGLVDPYE